MARLSLLKSICVLVLLCIVTAIASPAQTYTTMHVFVGTDGETPEVPMIQGANGNFYGTTIGGGPSFDWHDRSYGYGTIFEISPSGTLTALYDFCVQTGCADGAYPGGLTQGVDRNFYGVTLAGGSSTQAICADNGGCGTIFRLTPEGMLTTIYNFCSQTNCADGWVTAAALVQGADGAFYGTTRFGGSGGWGTVFRITPTGQLTTLYNFCSTINCEDGQIPTAGLVQGANGDFYGVTQDGGSPFWSAGTVFRLKVDGTFTTLHRFCNKSRCSDGAHPNTPLVVGDDGNLYGTTSGGVGGGRTVFKISPTGNFTTLYTFGTVEGDGGSPQGLLQANDGNFYGTTGGAGCFTPCPDDGAVFELTPAGQLTPIYSFVGSPGAYGAHPLAGLVQGTNGVFYGTTYLTTENKGNGVVFSLSTGLSPFIETNPASGIVGRTIGILGNYLTSTTGISFNGTPAKAFTVVSDSLIEAPVPVGATTGYVTVTTPGGTLTSNVPFQVIQ